MKVLLRGGLWSSQKRRVSAAVVVALLALPLYAFFAPFDAPESLAPMPGTVVLGADGTVLQRDGAAGLRIPVALDQVSPLMRAATIAAEDQRFEHHPGVDPLAMLRAARHFRSQRSGASTITQQLARRLYLDGGGGPLPLRKTRESLIAFQLEAHRSKDEILALYLNDIYYGRGAYGVEAAARTYFGISAANLDLASAAFLAGLPQLPSAYDPIDNDRPARTRQAYVLDRMVGGGHVSRAEADAAKAGPLHLLPPLEPAIGAQFVAFALAELERIRPDLAGRRDLIVETTLDAGLQVEAERLVRAHLEALTERNVTNGAVVVVEPGTGRLLAMVGSATDGAPAHGGAINMANEPRQPGSALKPFLYAAALEHGYTAATPLLDVPSTFITPQGPYVPLNYDRAFHGVVSLRTALASSLNVPAVRTLDALGMEALLDMAHRFGLSTLTNAESYGLALTLGGGDVRLLDMASAYAALGAGGQYVAPFAVTRVRDRAGRILYQHAMVQPHSVLSPEHAYLITDILSDPNARVVGFGQVTPFDLPFRAAVKTGTTTGFRDNWTLGYTPEIAVGVWVGNANGASMRDVSGVDGAGPIWRDVMIAAAKTWPMSWHERPLGIVETTVCAPIGLLPGPDCPFPQREQFAAGTVPTERERYWVRDVSGDIFINPPLEAQAWARDVGFRIAATGGSERLHFVQPGAGSVFFMSPELHSQEVVLRVAAPPGAGLVSFRINGREIGQSPANDARLVWRLEPGATRVEASAKLADGSIAFATTTYEVRAP